MINHEANRIENTFSELFSNKFEPATEIIFVYLSDAIQFVKHNPEYYLEGLKAIKK